jgi:hypothetical protein
MRQLLAERFAQGFVVVHDKDRPRASHVDSRLAERRYVAVVKVHPRQDAARTTLAGPPILGGTDLAALLRRNTTCR